MDPVSLRRKGVVLEAAFEQLRHDIAKAARISFTAHREKHPDEDFYAFALYTDQDACGPTPAASTEQSLARAIKRYSDGGHEPPDMAFLRYVPDEWAYLGAEGNPEDWHTIWKTVDELYEDDSMPFPTFRRRVWTALIHALADLDAEGLFGTGAERERITLLIWPSQASGAEPWWIRSVRELNPETVWKRFLSELPPSCEEFVAADARFAEQVPGTLFEQLRQQAAKAARHSFGRYRERRPNDDFNGFALLADADVSCYVPTASTEQTIQALIQRYTDDGEEVPPLNRLRYYPMDWGIFSEYDDEGKEPWQVVIDMLSQLSEHPGLSAEAYRERALETMILALKDLDAEGFFGTGAERERVILLVWVEQSEDTAAWFVRSAEALNPKAVFERFLSGLSP